MHLFAPATFFHARQDVSVPSPVGSLPPQGISGHFFAIARLLFAMCLFATPVLSKTPLFLCDAPLCPRSTVHLCSRPCRHNARLCKAHAQPCTSVPMRCASLLTLNNAYLCQRSATCHHKAPNCNAHAQQCTSAHVLTATMRLSAKPTLNDESRCNAHAQPCTSFPMLNHVPLCHCPTRHFCSHAQRLFSGAIHDFANFGFYCA